MTEPLTVAIAIPTFRRPDRLAALLALLPARVAELDARTALTTVLVVDNDPEQSARPVAERQWQVPVQYAPEPTPGIAAARNHAMDAAADAQLLAFIDDDELPQPGWLHALVECYRSHDVAAVMGRVISDLPEHLDPWLRATGTFRRRVLASGTPISVAAAGNLLLDLARVRAAGVRFDPGLGLAGGEDSLFSQQLVSRGGRIVWCGESIAVDEVTPTRLTRAWARTRAFNTGNAAINVALRLHPGPAAQLGIRARAMVGGIGRIGVGGARHLFGRVAHRLDDDARGWRLVHRGRGMLAAAFGHVHLEYRREA